MKIVFLTAGAAGMFCGSCMHDNAVAKALRAAGHDCLLQPVYTPIRTDDASIATEQVFFGGVHIYLLQRFPALRWVPARWRRLLDRPKFIRWATRGAGSTNAAVLGDLALSMLRGEQGGQRDEVARLVHWLKNDIRPDAILFSNLLIGGCLPSLRRELPDTKLVAVLQGDDAFLDHLPPAYRDAAITELKRLSRDLDAIIVNSRFYGEKMSRMIGFDPSLIRLLPLTIDTAPFINWASSTTPTTTRVGYLARISPEKGLHRLVDAFCDLAKRPQMENVHLSVAGYLGAQHHEYLEGLRAKIRSQGLSDRFEYIGSPDLNQKLAWLRSIDLLSVPTEHEEPKGLFLLEAMAAGIPVVQNQRGAFPEMIERTGGGICVPHDDSGALADGLQSLIIDDPLRTRLGQQGRQAVLQQHHVQAHAADLIQLLQDL